MGTFMASNVPKVAVISGWNGSDRSMGPRGHVRCLDLVMEGPARCSMGPKSSLERVFFSLKSPVLRGFSSTFLASNVTKVAVVSGWNGLDGSMGPKGHVRYLDLVMGDLPGAQWVQNHRLRGSFCLA